MGNLARNTRLLAGLVLALCVAAGAVGSAGGAAYAKGTQLVEHWDGSAWTESNAPGPKRGSYLAAVTAIAATDVWAVGTSSIGTPDTLRSYPIAARWNGASWQTMQLPTPNRADPWELTAVSGRAVKDVWAVGGLSGEALIEHWSGKRWKIAAVQHGVNLSDVTTLSRRNAWAVGARYVTPNSGNPSVLIEHWNGRAWRPVAAPDPRSRIGFLSAVAAGSARNIWAVGGYGSSHRAHQLLVHWNGVVWKQFAGPTLRHGSQLEDVTVIGAHDAWAIGSEGRQPFVEHWNGNRWHVVSIRLPKASDLESIAAVNAADIWAVGATGSPFQTLAAHWDGNAWSVVPTTDRPGNSDDLSGVAAVSTGDVWGVGFSSAP